MLTKRFTKAKVLPLFFWFEVVEVLNLFSFCSSAPLDLVVAVRVLIIQLFKWISKTTASSSQSGRFNNL